ncbi:MAG: hypothetical protein HQ538_00810 [Parcubacteria group bacterium]|nr:hypothetical protein [Parcubacteria group bacterium]
MVEYTNKFKIVLFSVIILLIFTAFGCKEQESSEDSSNSVLSNTQLDEGVVYNQAEEQNNVQNENKEDTTTQDESNDSSATNNESDDETLLLKQSEKLAEIYGTYTNKDKTSYKNLKDIRQNCTVKLQDWIDEISSIQIDKNASFYGVTTEALSSIVLEKSKSKSKILVTTRREEITSNSNTPKISYKVLLMLFEKIGENWKLDGIYWQD